MTVDFAKTGLPVVDILPALKNALKISPAVVLQAAPGAGKTTLVPLYLLSAGLAGPKKIIMLEPRRLAARAAARRMASLMGEEVGETVGHRVRMDTKVSRRTRIEVVTEGILTRRLQTDPELSDIGLIIFDEFHERSLQTDLGLALSRQVQEILREDLKILVMSATLDMGRLASFLGHAPVVQSTGRQFPVESRFLDRPPTGRIEGNVVQAVKRAMTEECGDILVFLPGAGEINRTQKLLAGSHALADALVLPLYGNLSQKEQDMAIEPGPAGRRKIVLSTDIAETSLTIEGVRVVIDAGQARSAVFDPNSGMSQLVTQRVSRASADQRRGRAGRLGPGICYRLWTAAEDRGLTEHAAPEIMTADLSTLVLELAKWGVQDVSELTWMSEPPAGLVSQAKDILKALGALDGEGKITPLGEEIVRLPLHPRLAGMVIRARDIGAESFACDIAALLSERDIFRRDREFPNADLRDRLEILAQARRKKTRQAGYETAAINQVLRVSQDLARRLAIKQKDMDVSRAGLLLAFAYPDRIGELREESRLQYRLSGGRGARLSENDRLQGEPYVVVADLDGKGREARIDLAAPILARDIEENFAASIILARRVFWDDKRERVLAVSERKLGALLLSQQRIDIPAPEEIADALLGAVRRKGLQMLSWDAAARTLTDRANFARKHEPEAGWPDFSTAALSETLDDWLLPYLAGMSRLAEVQRLNLADILQDQLSRDQLARLRKFAPEAIEVPSGSHIRLDYADPDNPVLAVRLQEVFGLKEVPKLADGKVSVSVHLLSPARRPVQITQDLGSFWRTTYQEVKKDLKGRYPKHYWPDDPLQAEATQRVKPKKS
ncbi:MAG: ATP-dependent helicase HrpB [Sneathiella sp.]|nr:ATP-dependent helicase HrpB [Sneathiella sp.]